VDLSICSYSFHRLLEAGQQDIFRYITDCKELGCTLLDPWNGHLPQLLPQNNGGAGAKGETLSSEEENYLKRIKAAADEVGLPIGGLAVDGAHIYEAEPEKRKANRIEAYRWLNIGEKLGAQQMRIDAGGTAEMPDEMFQIIIDGYHDLVKRAQDKGIELLIENHWGASNRPENVVRILDAAPGLGLLFDTHNWAPGTQQQGWELCAHYAKATHVKTFVFDDAGNETTTDIPQVIHRLVETGYRGAWGIESCPRNEDEYSGARKTIDLIRRVLA